MRYSRDESEFDRAVAFIDAAFALALTLLVTSLDIDDRPSAFGSLSSLGDAVGPQFVTFLIAFAVIASYWLQHHRMVARFVAIDVRTIVANLCLVAGIVLRHARIVFEPGRDELAHHPALTWAGRANLH